MTRRLALGLAAATLLLAGCAAVPDSGTVQKGDEIAQSGDASVSFSPAGPAAGASPDDIVLGFIQAQTSAEDDFAIAREFLADSVKTSWDPTAAVAISSGTASLEQVEGDSSARLYSFSQTARVDSSGQYTDDGTTTQASRGFELVQQDGEWRIDQLDDGIVLASDVFASVFSQYELYFYDPDYRYLVPDVRWYPVSTLTGSRIVEGLLAGPGDLLAQATATAFPQGAKLASTVSVESGTATVDFEDAGSGAQSIDDLSLEARALMRDQITASLSSYTSVFSVVLTVGGVELDVPSVASTAVLDPDVGTLPLVVDDDGLVLAGTSATSIDGVTDAASGLSDITGGAYAIDSGTAAVLASGGVYRLEGGRATLLDSRSGLIAPSLDQYGYIWTVGASGAVRAIGSDGAVTEMPATLVPSGCSVVSLDVSRDGTRLLLYLSATDGSGAELFVVGIARSSEGRIPTTTRSIELPVAGGTPIDAAWVDDHTVATISGGDTAVVTSYTVGGIAERIGTVDGARTIVGGSTGVDGIRVLTTEGAVVAERSITFQDTGVSATALLTQQPG
ncbi:MAG: GerMN domain-containing protein [Microbacteriaceae bacterium]